MRIFINTSSKSKGRGRHSRLRLLAACALLPLLLCGCDGTLTAGDIPAEWLEKYGMTAEELLQLNAEQMEQMAANFDDEVVELSLAPGAQPPFELAVAAPTPTETPVPTPTPTPSPSPTPTPTASPSPSPTASPEKTATPKPTAKATATPKLTAKPTAKPTSAPKPTAEPTAVPTEAPTQAPESAGGVSSGSYAYDDLVLAAKVAYLEARGNGEAGYRAVLNVIYNRCLSKKYGGGLTSISTEVYRKSQFSVIGHDDFDTMTPPSEIVEYADEIFNLGITSLPSDVLFFRSAKSGTSWGDKIYYETIGGNAFFQPGP